MCVSGSGNTLDEIATRLVMSGAPGGSVTARIASELVRTSSPSRSEMRGSEPDSFVRPSSRLVPSAPAATTTPRAVWVRRSRCSQAPVRSLVTA